MKTIYRITSKETGEVFLKKRKIAKAYRWWLRENGFVYFSTFFIQ
jgi:aspartyl/asparaginyl-tRNA synthetase